MTPNRRPPVTPAEVAAVDRGEGDWWMERRLGQLVERMANNQGANMEDVYAVVVVITEQPAEPGGKPAVRMEWVEAWPRTTEGIITATTRAARLSAKGEPHEVHRPDGRLLGRWVGGRRADLPPGGIIRLANEKRAAGS
jgi:hypothetical protein